MHYYDKLMNPSRKKILDKSFGLFLSRSYESVSMQEVQEAVNISRGAIYHHFKGKADIYNEVVNDYLLPIFYNYPMLPEEEKRTLQETIYASIKMRSSHIAQLRELTTEKAVDFYFFKFVFQATEHCADFREKVGQLMEKEFNGWKSSILTAVRTGEIRSDLDPDYVAQWFMTTPFGLGVATGFSNFENLDINDLRMSYLRLYNLLKKNAFR